MRRTKIQIIRELRAALLKIAAHVCECEWSEDCSCYYALQEIAKDTIVDVTPVDPDAERHRRITERLRAAKR